MGKGAGKNRRAVRRTCCYRSKPLPCLTISAFQKQREPGRCTAAGRGAQLCRAAGHRCPLLGPPMGQLAPLMHHHPRSHPQSPLGIGTSLNQGKPAPRKSATGYPSWLTSFPFSEQQIAALANRPPFVGPGLPPPGSQAHTWADTQGHMFSPWGAVPWKHAGHGGGLGSLRSQWEWRSPHGLLVFWGVTLRQVNFQGLPFCS